MKFKPRSFLLPGLVTLPPEDMRSIVPGPEGGDDTSTNDDDDPNKPLFSYCWWRSAPEFDRHGRPTAHLFPTNAVEAASLSPRARVLKEMERLALVAHESIDEHRHKLLCYHSGDLWDPVGGVAKEETDIPPVISVLLVGFAASGKSSLVNLMYSVLGRSGLVPFAHTYSSVKDGRTKCLEEHNVLRSAKNGFCVYDSRGLDYVRTAAGLAEVAGWMEEGVRHHQICTFEGEHGEALNRGNKFVRRKVNSVMVVVSSSEVYHALKTGDSGPLEATKELFHAPSLTISNQNPILVLTHGDELSTEERIEARVNISEFLGVSETTGVYDIACLNEYGLLVDELDPVTACALAEAVYRALLFADRSHRPKDSVKDWFLRLASWIMWSLSALFAFLSYCCSKLASGDHKLKL